MESHWQVQDAKQRLSELLRKAIAEGPQFVTRHGEEVAVVIDIVYFRELTGVDIEVDFKHALSGPAPLDDAIVDVIDAVVADRASELPRDVDLAAAT